MLNKETINFEEYDIEFEKNEFNDMSEKELRECDEILQKIEAIIRKEEG